MDCSAEANLVNALFVTDPQEIDTALLIVQPDELQNANHRAFYRAMKWCRDNAQPIDSVSVWKAFGELKIDDGGVIIASAFDAWPMAGQIERYANVVKEESRAARVEYMIKLASERLTDGEPLKWVKDELVLDIQQSDYEARSQEGCHISEAADETIAIMFERSIGSTEHTGLKTGISNLDLMTTGINREQLWIVGGMPGRGKTAFALQTAMNVAGDGNAVHFISLEMSRNALMSRLLKMQFGASAVENPAKHIHSFRAYRDELATVPLYIDDLSSLDIDEVVARARARIARSGSQLVIVDYIQLIRAKGRDRREQMGEATDRLRCLAKDSGVPIMALSQLRRPDNIDDQPSMIELKESGDIEAHAHVVLLLYMPTDPERRGEDSIIIGKQREGPTGRVDVTFMGEKGIFVERWAKHDDV